MVKIPYVTTNGIKLYYEIHGEGHPLVMIMGLSANLDWWNPEFLNAMTEKFKVITFDNRDAGRSEKSKEVYMIKIFAEDTIGLIDELGIEKAHFLGVSMGGMIAQEIALNFPERVNKLVLCSTNCGNPKSKLPSQEVLKVLTQERDDITSEQIIEETIPLLFTDEFRETNQELVEQTKFNMLKAPIEPSAYRRQINAILKFNSGRRLKKLKIPTLIIHGKKDILIPPENAEILSNLIPNSNVQLFEKSAHGIFMHEPKKVIKAVLEFLEH
ncbi:MAG: alpha/beta hydrolase [Candidatus Lokiarchaeota archaeon]